MNKIFRLIWSRVKEAWVVVAEKVAAKGGPRPTTVGGALATAALALGVGTATALPTGPQVISGTAGIATSGSTMTVTNSHNAIINWQGFNIAANETTKFVQPSALSAVLNRVVGGNPSQILGALQSNGKVLLINPSGIIFGPNARVDVNGLIASSLDIANQDFLAGRMKFHAGPLAGKVENQGAITTPSGGQVYLIAPDVENSGVITAPNGDVLLAAGKEVLLVDSANPEIALVVTAPEGQALNLGTIVADAGRVGMYGSVVRQQGRISADSAVAEGGKIFFRATKQATLEQGSTTTATGTKGGTVQVLGEHAGLLDNAVVDVSGTTGGGTVLVGGNYQGRSLSGVEGEIIPNAEITYMAKNATIKADAGDNGNGGKVVLWSDDTTRYYGSISAKGGLLGGDGGFVEVSGKRYLDFRGLVDTAAFRGDTGTLLLDPTDITITALGGAPTFGSFSGSTDQIFDGGTNTSSSMGWDYINGLLSGNNVIVQTNSTGGGTGNITFAEAGVSAGGTNSLSFLAENNISINNNIQFTSSGALIFSAANAIAVNADISSTGGGAVTLTTTSAAKTISIATAKSLSTTNGAVTLQSDIMELQGAISAGTGLVTLKPYTAATAIQLGAADSAGILGLTASELSGITTTGGLTIGSEASTGTLSVVGDVSFTTPTSLITSGSLSTTAQISLLAGAALGLRGSSNTSDITIGGIISKTAGTDTSLTLRAGRSIVVNQPISSTTGKLDVTLNAHYLTDTDPGSVAIHNNITTYGGNLVIGGGTIPATIPAIGYGNASNDQCYGVYLQGGNISTGGGNIIINGQGVANSTTDADGINLDAAQLHAGGGNIALVGKTGNNPTSATAGIYSDATIDTTGTGTISLTGVGGDGTISNIRGVNLIGGAIQVVNGALSIAGYGGDSSASGNYGVWLDGASGSPLQIGSTGTGAITLTGAPCQSDCSNTPINDNVGVLLNDEFVSISSSGAAITIDGSGTGSGTGNHGVQIGGTITNSTGEVTLTGSGAVGSSGILEAGSGVVQAATLRTDSVRGSLLNNNNVVTSYSAQNATSGNIELANTVALTLNGLHINQSGGGNVTITNTDALSSIGWVQTTGNGNISLTASGGSATIGNSLIASNDDAGNGTVSVTATGATSDVVLNDINVYSGSTGGGSGNITLNAGRDLKLWAAVSTTGTVSLDALGAIIKTGAGSIAGSTINFQGNGSTGSIGASGTPILTSGTSTINFGASEFGPSSVYMNHTGNATIGTTYLTTNAPFVFEATGDLYVTSSLNSGTGDVKLAVGAGKAITVGSTFSLLGNKISLKADRIDLSSATAVGSTASTVALMPATASRPIWIKDTADHLGTSTALEFTPGELAKVNSDVGSTMILGDADLLSNTGAIIFKNNTTDVTRVNGSLVLATAGSVEQDVTTPGKISTPLLAIRAGGDVILNRAVNSVGVFAADLSSGTNGSVQLSTSGNLTVGKMTTINGFVPDIAGLSTASGAVFPDGYASLVAGGAITQAADGLIGMRGVRATGTSVTLDQLNSTGVIAGAATAGDFSYTSIHPISVTTVDSVSGVTATGQVSLTGTSVGQTASASEVITAGSLKAIATTGGVNLVNDNLISGTVAGSTATNFSFKNTGDFSIGDETSGITASAGTISLNTVGTVTQTKPISATGLELLGVGGSYTLNDTSNSITTLAGNTGSVSLTNSAANWSIGTVNTVGLTTTGSSTLAGTGTLTNSSSIRVNAGTMAVSTSSFTQSGTIDVASSTTFSRTSGFTNTGTISGNGTIAVGTSAAGLMNQGIITPGGDGTAGTLTINGDLQLSTGSNLKIDIGGAIPDTGYDVLTVSGAATLGGTLNGTLINSFTPSGQSFDVISANTASGSFTTSNLPLGTNGAIITGTPYYYRLTHSGGTCTGVCWDGGAGTMNWEDINNWSGDALPLSADMTYLNLVAGVTVNLASSQTIKGLYSDVNNHLTINSSGALTLFDAATTSTLLGNLTINGGTLTANGITSLAALNLAAGTLSGTGSLTVTNSFSGTGGSINSAFSSLKINQAAGNLAIDIPVTVSGMVSLNATGGTITQAAGATIDATSLQASGTSVILTEANQVGVIAGAATAGDFSYTSASGIAVTTVDSVPGISASNQVSLTTNNVAGIVQNPDGAIIAPGGATLTATTGPVSVRSISTSATAPGNLLVQANGDITVNGMLAASGSTGGQVELNSTNGNILFSGTGTVTASGSGGLVKVNAPAGSISSDYNGTPVVTAENAILKANQGIFGPPAGGGGYYNLSLGVNNLDLTNSGTTTTMPNHWAIVQNNQDLTITDLDSDGKSINLNTSNTAAYVGIGANGNLTLQPGIVSSSGHFAATNLLHLYSPINFSGSASFRGSTINVAGNVAAQNVYYTADTLNLGAATTAATYGLTIAPYTLSRPITIADTDPENALWLAPSVFSNFSTDFLQLGQIDALNMTPVNTGPITINSNLVGTAATFINLGLTSDGLISQSGGSIVLEAFNATTCPDCGQLKVAGGTGGIDLQDLGNSVDILSAKTTSGNISFTNSKTLQLGPGDGIVTAGGNILIATPNIGSSINVMAPGIDACFGRTSGCTSTVILSAYDSISSPLIRAGSAVSLYADHGNVTDTDGALNNIVCGNDGGSVVLNYEGIQSQGINFSLAS